MFGKFILVFLFIGAITQTKCQNTESSGKSRIPPSYVGEIIRRTADIKLKFATIVDEIVAAFNNALKFNTGGLFGNVYNNNRNFADDPDQYREAVDMNNQAEAKVINRKVIKKKKFDGSYIRSDSIAKLIGDLCTEGRVIPGVCNE